MLANSQSPSTPPLPKGQFILSGWLASQPKGVAVPLPVDGEELHPRSICIRCR